MVNWQNKHQMILTWEVNNKCLTGYWEAVNSKNWKEALTFWQCLVGNPLDHSIYKNIFRVLVVKNKLFNLFVCILVCVNQGKLSPDIKDPNNQKPSKSVNLWKKSNLFKIVHEPSVGLSWILHRWWYKVSYNFNYFSFLDDFEIFTHKGLFKYDVSVFLAFLDTDLSARISN